MGTENKSTVEPLPAKIPQDNKLDKKASKGISRIDRDGKRTHGWYVRVYFNGKTYNKFFNDEKYKGSEKAFTKALDYRNSLEKTFGKPRTERKVVIQNSKNRTGMLGVRRVSKQGQEYYEVLWNPTPNIIKRSYFPIKRYGEKGALLKAIKLRKRKEKEIYGKPIRFIAKTTNEESL